MPSCDRAHLSALLAAALALVVVHALGRFAYTPLLPLLLDDGLFDLGQGAQLATWNYLGYLLGALLALPMATPRGLRLGLPAALLINAGLTLAQVFTQDIALLAALRLSNGISNGVVFVLAPALVLEWLALRQATALSGLVYLGLGGGMLLCGLLVAITPWQGPLRWLPIALCALPLALLCAPMLSGLARGLPGNSQGTPESRLLNARNLPLLLAYLGAGLGYILPLTFLPALAREQLPAGHPLLVGNWWWTALACLISASLWNQAGAWLGDRRALLANYLLQLLGVAMPILLPGPVGVLACALLVGGSFLGTVLLTQRLARALNPDQGLRLAALLISLYGGSQLLGPWLVQHWTAAGHSLTSSFSIGAAALLWALLWAWRVAEAPSTR
ncbi:YbfB/YjiJ family MFS transporter [Pseudomonas sp. NPDC077186]|uniref:YbfB/YjiJ family MFS transporter n=1 Tax=Pseudomonas sp. NPDC077186 TaxID=3364421 RepID=UPI0037C78465